MAQTWGLVGTLVLISPWPGLLILAYFEVLSRYQRNGIGATQVHHQPREDYHAHPEVLDQAKEIIIVFEQELLRFQLLAGVALI